MRIETTFLTALLFFHTTSSLQAGTQDWDPATCMPPGRSLYAEVTDVDGLVTAISGARLGQSFAKLGLVKEARKDEGLDKLIESFEVLRPILEGRVGIGFKQEKAGARFLVVSENRGSISLQAAARLIAGLAEGLTIGEPTQNFGAEILDLGSLGALAARDGRLYWANNSFLLRRSLRLEASKSPDRKVTVPGLSSRDPQAEIFVVASPRELYAGKYDQLTPPDNFLGALLLNGVIEELRTATRATLQGRLTPLPDLRLELVRPGHSVAWATASRPRRNHSSLDGSLAEIHLDRDLAAFWSRRFDDVHESGHQGLVEFGQAMNTFFSGFPFDEIMSGVRAGADFVIAPQRRPEGAEPDILLPGFALVLEHGFDAEQRQRFQVAFQTAVGIVNASAAEERRQPMLQFARKVNDSEIFAARFLADPINGTKATTYNFSPAITFVGSQLILSSSVSLAEDLARNIQTVRPGVTKARGDEVILTGAPVFAALRDNLEVLAEQQVLEKGKDLDQARIELVALFDAFDFVAGAEFSHVDHADHSIWRLEFKEARKGSK